MSRKTIELLLVENVESLGIVGDVVNVKIGFARNFLLPRELATAPSEEKIAELAERRAVAERERAAIRERREQDVEKMREFEITLERSCNDQGHLYGSVTQQDIANALLEEGFAVRDRDVRLSHTIKRIDSYEITVRPEPDLEAIVKLWVVSDRELPTDEESGGVEVDDEGNLIEPQAQAEGSADEASADEAATKPETADA